ncbi:hypothetical protein GQ44DRAFT_696577 [Phaeosphaeriaceae sp. PMI808]|nr:hypothetical protein GQ44DRAFT_696577 [Phaeosphaeriaceae sp. PMI808]
MRKSTVSHTILLSLLDLSAQQSVTSWGEPFTVDITASSSREKLASTSTRPNPSVPISLASASPSISVSTSTHPSPSVPISLTSASPSISVSTSLNTVSSFTVNLPSPTGSGLTVSTPLSGSIRSGSVTGSATGVQSTGGAVHFRKMGLAGALAGAAGVLFV